MIKSLPSIADCLQFGDDYGMYDNIRAHSLQVARVSYVLYQGLVGCGSAQNIPSQELILAGALLHDIAKTLCLQEGCKHADVGFKICMELGYPEIADIVGQHVILSSYDEELYSKGQFNAAAIVYYADKRVRHEEIVSLDQRLAYIIDVYGKGDAKTIAAIHKNFSRCQYLEKFLFAHLPFAVDDVAERVAKSSILPSNS